MNILMKKELKNGEYIVESRINGRRLIVDSEGLAFVNELALKRDCLECASDKSELVEYLFRPIESIDFEDIFHVQWHITDRCNLRCKHCYQMDYTPSFDNSYEENIGVFEKLQEYTNKRGKRLEISITGGEPLLEEKLFQFIEYIKEKVPDIRIFLLTNGTLLNEDIIEKIKKNELTGVQISLDGSDALTHDKIRGKGSFDKACNAITCLVDKKIYTSVHTVLQTENIDDIDNMVFLCDKLHVSRLTFSRLVPIGNAKQRKNSFLSADKIKKAYYHIYDLKVKKGFEFINLERDLWQIIDSNCGSTCPAGTSSITLLHDGTVVPCRRVPIEIGNIKESSLDELLFYSKTVEDFELCSPVECENCKVFSTCKGGCQAIAFAMYGAIGKYADPQCWIRGKNNLKILAEYEREFEYIAERDCYVRKRR